MCSHSESQICILTIDIIRAHVSDSKPQEMDAMFACNDVTGIQINFQVLHAFDAVNR